MKITLYQRTYPVDGAPVSLSLGPFPAGSICTFPVGDRVYEATYSEVHVVVPDDAKVDTLKGRVVWAGDKGLVRSTAKEVFDLAQARTSGFRLA
jgi:hypothetical protein